MRYKATIIERGNGFPSPGDYCSNGSCLFRVVSFSGPIHTGRRAGDSEWIHATVEDADWDDCAEHDQFRAAIELDTEDA